MHLTSILEAKDLVKPSGERVVWSGATPHSGSGACVTFVLQIFCPASD